MRQIKLGKFPTLEYACKEAVNTLASNITFSGSGHRSIMVTSCHPNEGKSYIAFHLTNALCAMGYSCVLLDADMRKSVFFSRYEASVIGEQVGLSHYLAGKNTIDDILYKVEDSRLCVVPAGKSVVNSLPLLASVEFSEMMGQLKQYFDFVIVDAPPIGMLVDAAMIASSCDTTLFTTISERSRRDLIEGINKIKQSNPNILGVVLNKVDMGTQKYKKYYYRSQQYYTYYTYGKEK